MGTLFVEKIRATLFQNLKTFSQLAKDYGLNAGTLKSFVRGHNQVSPTCCIAFVKKHPELIEEWKKASQEPMVIKIQRTASKWDNRIKTQMEAAKYEDEKIMQKMRSFLAEDPRNCTDLAQEYGVSSVAIHQFLNGSNFRSKKLYKSFQDKNPDLVALWIGKEENYTPFTGKIRFNRNEWKDQLEIELQSQKSGNFDIYQTLRIYMLQKLIQNPEIYDTITNEKKICKKVLRAFLTGNQKKSNVLLKLVEEKEPDVVAQWIQKTGRASTFFLKRAKYKYKDNLKNRLEIELLSQKLGNFDVHQNMRVYILQTLVENSKGLEVLAAECRIPRTTLGGFLYGRKKTSPSLLKVFEEKDPELVAQWIQKSESNGNEQK